MNGIPSEKIYVRNPWSLLVILRLYFFLRLLLSRYYTGGTKILGLWFNFAFHTPFATRNMLYSHPLQSLLPVVMILILSCSYGLYVFEREFVDRDFYYSTSLWLTVVTVCSLGFGDVVPISSGGKVICIIIAFTGLLVTAVLVAAVHQKLTLLPYEGRMVEFLERDTNTSILRNFAARCIQRAWIYFVNKKRARQLMRQKKFGLSSRLHLLSLQTSLLQGIFDFQSERKKIQAYDRRYQSEQLFRYMLENLHDKMESVSLDLRVLEDEMDLQFEENQEIFQRLAEVKDALKKNAKFVKKTLHTEFKHQKKSSGAKGRSRHMSKNNNKSQKRRRRSQASAHEQQDGTRRGVIVIREGQAHRTDSEEEEEEEDDFYEADTSSDEYSSSSYSDSDSDDESDEYSDSTGSDFSSDYDSDDSDTSPDAEKDKQKEGQHDTADAHDGDPHSPHDHKRKTQKKKSSSRKKKQKHGHGSKHKHKSARPDQPEKEHGVARRSVTGSLLALHSGGVGVGVGLSNGMTMEDRAKADKVQQRERRRSEKRAAVAADKEKEKEAKKKKKQQQQLKKRESQISTTVPTTTTDETTNTNDLKSSPSASPHSNDQPLSLHTENDSVSQPLSSPQSEEYKQPLALANQPRIYNFEHSSSDGTGNVRLIVKPGASGVINPLLSPPSTSGHSTHGAPAGQTISIVTPPSGTIALLSPDNLQTSNATTMGAAGPGLLYPSSGLISPSLSQYQHDSVFGAVSPDPSASTIGLTSQTGTHLDIPTHHTTHHSIYQHPSVIGAGAGAGGHHSQQPSLSRNATSPAYASPSQGPSAAQSPLSTMQAHHTTNTTQNTTSTMTPARAALQRQFTLDGAGAGVSGSQAKPSLDELLLKQGGGVHSLLNHNVKRQAAVAAATGGLQKGLPTGQSNPNLALSNMQQPSLNRTNTDMQHNRGASQIGMGMSYANDDLNHSVINEQSDGTVSVSSNRRSIKILKGDDKEKKLGDRVLSSGNLGTTTSGGTDASDNLAQALALLSHTPNTVSKTTFGESDANIHRAAAQREKERQAHIQLMRERGENRERARSVLAHKYNRAGGLTLMSHDTFNSTNPNMTPFGPNSAGVAGMPVISRANSIMRGKINIVSPGTNQPSLQSSPVLGSMSGPSNSTNNNNNVSNQQLSMLIQLMQGVTDRMNAIENRLAINPNTVSTVSIHPIPSNNGYGLNVQPSIAEGNGSSSSSSSTSSSSGSSPPPQLALHQSLPNLPHGN